jgi:hypothetical protein
MAINKIDSTGTKISVSDDGGTTWNQLGCIQSVGGLEETRPVTSYGCLSTNDSTKSLGAIERGTFDIQVLLDVNATSGAAQELVRAAFGSNDEIDVQIELSNSHGSHGTQYEFTAQVSKSTVTIAKDEAVMYDMSLEITSAITETDPA